MAAFSFSFFFFFHFLIIQHVTIWP